MMLDEWNDFHDWNLESVAIKGDFLYLIVSFKELRKLITFTGVSRCRFGDFFIQNIIYSFEYIDEFVNPQIYSEELNSLPTIPYHASKTKKSLMRINSSLGAYGIIEYDDFKIGSPPISNWSDS